MQETNLTSPPSSESVPSDETVEAEANTVTTNPSTLARRDDASCVQVAVRVRPIITLEGDDESCIQVLQHQQHQSGSGTYATAMQVGGSTGPRFTFDHVFGIKSTQQDIYNARVAPLVFSCLEGYNATILAYGQTGSGKTFTIMGPDPTTAAGSPQDTEVGVIPRAFAAIFQSLIDKKEEQRQIGVELEYQVSVQFLELYGEEIRDLLATHRNNSNRSSGPDKLFIRDLGTDEPEVVGATQMPVSSALQALRCLAHGMLRRVTGATAMNESSSRSHAILTVCIEQSSSVVACNLQKYQKSSSSSADGSYDGEDMNDDHVQMTRSKFNFVDLAGAERQKRTGASGKRLQEGIDINKGLSNLGNVISALGDPKKRGKTHVPYRDAKLTRLLKGSLGGNHKTLMIACVSPAVINMGESLNCLRYANRAKNIQNKAVVNVDANSRLVQELQGQVRALASDLLRALDGETDAVQFERATLISLASGSAGAVPMSPTPSKYDRDSSDVVLRLRDSEAELRRTQDKLRQSLSYQDAAELELHTVRAQNQLCDLQITALTNDTNAGSPVVTEAMETAFLEKVSKYEGEIGNLQKALREAESKLNARDWPPVTSDDDHEWLEKEERNLQRDQDRLESIRAMSFDDAETQYHTAYDSEQSYASGRDNDPTEADEENENSTVDALTKKIVGNDNDDAENEAPLVEEPPSRLVRVRTVAADLEELSLSIAMKEKLIEQIKRNKEREAMMRAFYESKMESLRCELEEKERERDELLKVANEQTIVSDELHDQLREKNAQIDTLKSRQKSFKLQTKKASRSEADIERLAILKSDVTKMKKRKADMQKELASEKRHRMKEVSTLNKIVVQKDREINKIQKISNQRAVDADILKAMAKTRLAELAQLKKALRLYKQGVGLDPVMVGRRQGRTKGIAEEIESSGKAASISINVDSIRDYFDEKVACVVRKEVLVDKLVKEWEDYFELHSRMKEFLNQSVEHSVSDLETLELEIRYKNDRIRKLARRVHKQDIPTQSNSAQDDSIQGDAFLFDEKFSTLCRGFAPELARKATVKVLFGMIVRERRRIAALAKAASSLDERVQAAEKQLSFSESALRSCMDDHHQEVADLEEKQHEHLLTLINMVKEDSNSMSRASFDIEDGENSLSEVKYQKMLLVLANERVAVLEDQLSELSSHKATIDEYSEQIEELDNSLTRKIKDCDSLEQTRIELRTGMRLIRDEVSKHSDMSGIELGTSILELVEIYLHGLSGPSDLDQCASTRMQSTQNTRQKALRSTLSPRFKMRVELMNSSDSDSESEAQQPDEAHTTIQRLVHLVVGSSDMPDAMADAWVSAEASVFDRLANPTSFTGTQKRNKNNRYESDSSSEVSPSIQSGRGENCDKLKEDSLTAGNGAYPSHKPISLGTESSALTGNGQQAYQSVFDRLGSPSQYTGTQKERFQDTKTKRDHGADVVLEKSLSLTPKGSSQHTGDKATAPTIRTDYTKLNVFDRLQTTTTQAAAIRQSETMNIEHRVDSKSTQNGSEGFHLPEGIRVSPVSEPSAISQFPADNGGDKRTGVDRAAYAKQNVFDRLQTTTTLAAAVRQSETLHQENRVHVESRPQISPVATGDTVVTSKKPDVKRSTSTHNSVSGSGPGRTDYRKQNVFERLNKTTTETFAKKTHRTKGDDSVG